MRLKSGSACLKPRQDGSQLLAGGSLLRQGGFRLRAAGSQAPCRCECRFSQAYHCFPWSVYVLSRGRNNQVTEVPVVTVENQSFLYLIIQAVWLYSFLYFLLLLLIPVVESRIISGLEPVTGQIISCDFTVTTVTVVKKT